ncbi:HAD-IA family hydrolase [Lentibacter sp. XHP0401]|uniref:HAD-IA family hydrolase n=1 Tax=Lentibacter sp. XHP0401 TaxID=2984334 RepID=UPI0021E8AB0E|nr:HAD-IA family hydrolase [Lentibacter sp. XHP0401]MCV2894703.1 HAD-IA family hydrolase [Lentibacter sp. XHP0401]
MRVVIFDVDGTLVDSQDDICAAMGAAFGSIGQEAPGRAEICAIVGLSLPEAMRVLAPELSAHHVALVEGYKASYMQLRADKGTAESSPLYDGALEALARLHAEDETLLAVATGKSRRGLTKLLEGYGLTGYFVSEQVADHHPSKPHPAMLEAVLRETGLAAHQAVMVGDTRFDMEMARAAGIATVGVRWGYHDANTLQADKLISHFDELHAAVNDLLGVPA